MKNLTIEQSINLYIEYFNNFLTVSGFAAAHDMTETQAEKIINIGRLSNELLCQLKNNKNSLTLKDSSIEIEVIRHDEIFDYNTEFDDDTCKSIRAKLNNGVAWAWCSVEVKATIKETDISISHHLGGCSYSSKQDFKKCDYYKSMVQECKNDLKAAAMAQKDILNNILKY